MPSHALTTFSLQGTLPAGHPLPYSHPCFIVTLLYTVQFYIDILKENLVRVLAMPHPLCRYTFRVLYACGQEFVSSVYFLPITWNGIPPPKYAWNPHTPP